MGIHCLSQDVALPTFGRFEATTPAHLKWSPTSAATTPRGAGMRWSTVDQDVAHVIGVPRTGVIERRRYKGAACPLPCAGSEPRLPSRHDLERLRR